jgi:hypothetical protein
LELLVILGIAMLGMAATGWRLGHDAAEREAERRDFARRVRDYVR